MLIKKLHFSENYHSGLIIDALAHSDDFRSNAIQGLRRQQIIGSAVENSSYEGPPNEVYVFPQLQINHDDSESVKGKLFNRKKNIVG